MRHIKQLFIKRVLVLMISTVLLSSSVFLSYENTMVVYAVDVSDLVVDAVCVAFASLGIILSGPTLPAVISILGPLMVAEGKDIYDYVTQDEETGTTTISEEFVNLVLQAYKDYKEENAEKFDGTMLPNENGYYHYDSISVVNFFSPMSESGNFSKTYTDINTYYPMAIVVYSNKTNYKNGNGKICYAHVVLYNKDDDKFYSKNLNKTTIAYGEDAYLSDFEQTIEGYGFLGKAHYVFRNTTTGETGLGEDYVYMAGSVGALPSTASITVNSSSVPVYHNLSSLKEGLRSGDFSAAWNYGKIPECETPSYTGEYTGGDITVDTELLEGIREKIEELEGTNKSIEELLKELLKWLKLNPGGGTGGGGGSVDVTVNVDMRETNNWLSKIYSKVSQIYDKISSSVGQSMDEVVESIENLKQMLKTYLSEITGDLDDIKGQLAEMSEEEFEERSDSFLEETTDSFSEISELAKTKFPFSIPNDLRILISKMVPPSSEPEAALYSVDTAGISLYSADTVGMLSDSEDHGGGGASMDDDEDDDLGGGGASRPPSGRFVSVEHGGGGGSRGAAEMKDGAPVFCLPIVIERYGIEEYIIVDMAPFEPVSKLSRTLFAIMFMLCLVNLTFKTMGLWGDLVD